MLWGRPGRGPAFAGWADRAARAGAAAGAACARPCVLRSGVRAPGPAPRALIGLWYDYGHTLPYPCARRRARAQVVVVEKGKHAPAAALSLLERDAFATLYEGAGLMTTTDSGAPRARARRSHPRPVAQPASGVRRRARQFYLRHRDVAGCMRTGLRPGQRARGLPRMPGGGARAASRERGPTGGAARRAGVNVMAGATLGGGTRINWSASFRTPDHVRREWARELGLTAFEGPRFTAALDAVCARIGVSTGARPQPRPHVSARAWASQALAGVPWLAARALPLSWWCHRRARGGGAASPARLAAQACSATTATTRR
jgi:hypothetical protein